MRTNSRCRAAAFISAGALFFGGCGGGAPVETGVPALTPPESSQDAHSDSAQQGFPAALPADALQPWETLSAEGYAVAPERGASYITAGSQFVPGVERALESATGVSDNGEAARFVSGAPGAGALSWAWYRLLMEGEQPGAVSADVNLLAMDDGSPSAYYIGLSDYGRGVWQWQGPFGDHHVRLSLPAGAYVSGLGNLFICVVAYDGAKFDVVGVAANPCDAADTTAPPAPTGLTATGIAGGLDLTWDEVDAADLAGYRVYYARLWFHSGASPGARMVGHLEGVARHVLPAGAKTYARVSAVDVSGNESPLSDIVSAFPLSGAAPDVRLSVAQPSGLLHDEIALTATGADSYDWDLDGDGVFDVTGDTTGTQQVNTSRTGVIRPAVRGLSSGGECVGCGGVSVIVSTNSRPLATGYADPSSGPVPLNVTFSGTGEDDDGTIVEYAWDFNGDGTYDYTHATEPDPPVHLYDTPGTYNAKFRVEDDLGSWDVDTVAVSANYPENIPPEAALTIGVGEARGNPPHTVNFDASASIDPDGFVNEYLWEFDRDSDYDEWSSTPFISHTYPDSGIYDALVCVVDEGGARDTAAVRVEVNSAPRVELDADVILGDPPLTVNFDASDTRDTDGTVEDYEWDLDGNGLFSEAGVEASARGSETASYTYNNAGSYLAGVRAIDNEGLAGGMTQGICVHGWVTVTVDHGGDVGQYTSLAVVDGNPAISYYDVTNGDLKFARAATHTGGGASDWTQIIVVDATADVGRYTSLAVVDGCPAISYLSYSQWKLKYARAETSTGGGPTDWTQVLTVDPNGLNGEYCSLAVVDGHPAISYFNYSDWRLMYARSTTSTGGSASDWSQIVTVDSADAVGIETSLAVVDGCPAISYYDSTNQTLKYARAMTSTGEYSSDWAAITLLASMSGTGRYSSLAVVDGCPAISHFNSNSLDLEYLRATTSTGADASDWTQAVTVDSDGQVGQYTSLAVVFDQPTIGYLGPSWDLKCAWATTSTGGSASHWTQIFAVDGPTNVGEYASLAEVCGSPGLAYYDATNGDLKYAFFYFSP